MVSEVSLRRKHLSWELNLGRQPQNKGREHTCRGVMWVQAQREEMAGGESETRRGKANVAGSNRARQSGERGT